MKSSSASLIPGFFLVGLGVIPLVKKLNLFYLDRPRTYPIIFMGIGLILFISAIKSKNNSAAFWGTILFLIGLLFFLRSYNFIDYYYGVKSSEARVGRRAYSPDGNINYCGGVDFGVGLSQDWRLMGQFSLEVLGREINASPIVEDEVIFWSVLGVARQF